MSADPIAAVVDYHDRTKHGFQRGARGPGYMDWANQPDPFRRYSGAPFVYLPIVVRDDSPPYIDMLQPDAVPASPVTIASLSRFLELSLAISAWKQSGDSRWALRSNPSSGNLHPTEGYLVLNALPGIHSLPGVYHYAPKEHGLERRTQIPSRLWDRLTAGFPKDAFLAGLTSIHWREAWKYGERAFRYCQHDMGHALAAYRLAAAALGWNMVLLEEVNDPVLAQLLGIDRKEDCGDAAPENADLIAAVFPGSLPDAIPLGLNREVVDQIAHGTWQGKANRLSQETVPWDIIDTVSHATVRLSQQPERVRELQSAAPWIFPDAGNSQREQRVTARQIIRQRRSAVALDGVTSISRKEFYRILLHTVDPRPGRAIPWDVISWSPRIHLGLFVHRVRDLDCGLYFLVRDPEKVDRLKGQMKKEFLWSRPQDCPPQLPLYLLQEGDYQSIAAQVSCTQEIAGQGAFSLGMVAEFLSSLQEMGPWFYRRLFWETGIIGQMLYLAAEHAGIRGTGIGCFFDDPVHDLFGFTDHGFQSLYHFTIGGPVEDKRLSTHPAYAWSCEISSGRFVSRPGLSKESEPANRVGPLSSSATVTFKGRTLSRIGAGLTGFSRLDPDHEEALDDLLQSPVNVIETSPDETAGVEEVLLGDALNRIVEKQRTGAEEYFIVSRIGTVQGRAGLLLQEMKNRGRAFADVVALDEGRWCCLHPDFLRDQLDRSRHRLGVRGIDLVLLRIPVHLGAVIGEEECLRRIERAAKFLQSECAARRLLAFGVSTPKFGFAENDPHLLSFAKLTEKLSGFADFAAIEFHGNFLDDEGFRPDSSGRSLVEAAREKGLCVFCDSPLRSARQDRRLVLADFPEKRPGDLEKEAAELLPDLVRWEKEIHHFPLADGRALAELLRQANMPFPFRFSEWMQAYLKTPVDSEEKLREMGEECHNALAHAQLFGDQLVQAELWQRDDLENIVRSAKTFLDRARQNRRFWLKAKASPRLNEFRQRVFPEAEASASLQSLGLRWLLDRGVAIVFNGMRRPAYVKEAVDLLRGL